MFADIRFKIFMFKSKIPLYKWRFWNWVFKWNYDKEGYQVFSICKRIHFINLNNCTMFYVGKIKYSNAPRRLSNNQW